MDLQSIEALLKKYYEGETTLAEEQQLRQFFESDQVPEHWQAEKGLFGFYHKASQEATTAPLPAFTETVGTQQERPVRSVSRFRTFGWLAAASVAIIFSTLVYLNPDVFTGPHETVDTYENPELAYAETKKALLLLSSKLNKGTEEVNQLKKLNEIEVLLSKKNN